MRIRNALTIVLAVTLILAPIQTVHADLQDGLEGYWNFDIDFTDSSPNGNDGTSGGGVSIDAGALLGSGAGLFDGTGTSYVDIGAPVTEFGDAFTISTWVKTSFTGGDVGILSKSNNDGGWNSAEKQFFLGNDGGGSVGSPNMVGHGVEWMHHNASADVRDGAWHQIAITFDVPGSANNMIYIDGAPVAATLSLNNYNGNNDPAGTLMRIGFDTSGEVNSNYNGLMDEMGVWSRALSGAEVSELYNGGAGLSFFNDGELISDASGGWNVLTTWVGDSANGVPSDSTIVTVLDTHIVTTSFLSPASAGTLTINTGGVVNVSASPLAVTDEIINNGALNIGAGQTVTADIASTAGVTFVDNTSTLNVANLTIDSAVDLDTAGITLDGNNITISATTGSLSMGATPAPYNVPTGNLNVQGVLINATDITVKNITMAAPYAIGSGSTLTAEAGALDNVSFGTAAVTGNAAINASNVAGEIEAVNFTILDNTTLVKNGAGKISFSGTSTIGTGAVVDVNAGHIALASAPTGLDIIQLDGGTFETSGVLVGSFATGISQSMFFGMPRNDTATNLTGAAYFPSNTRVFTGDKAGTVLDPGSYTAEHSGVATGEILHWNTFPTFDGNREDEVTAFSGVFRPSETGDYRFRFDCDDRAWMWIDMDNNGVFDAGENVANYDWHSNGTKSLTAGESYNYMAFAHEHGGGQSVQWWVTKPSGGEDRVNPSDTAGNGGEWLVGAETNEAINMPTTGVVVNANSNLIANTDSTATFGALTLNSGIVTVTGVGEKTIFDGTSAPASAVTGVTANSGLELGALTVGAGADVTIGGTTVTAASVDLDTSAIIRTIGNVDFSNYNEGAAATSLTLAGTGNLDMRNLGASAAEGTTFTTQESATLILGGDTPLGGSLEALNLDGGTIRIEATEALAPGALTFDFESGTLDGWNIVATGHGTDTVYTSGSMPTQEQGSWAIRTDVNGNNDNSTGTIRSDTFILNGGTIDFRMLGGNYPFKGDPDAPEVDMLAVTLEREVSPGDWEMVESAVVNNSNSFQARSWDTSAYNVGDTFRIGIYDTRAGGWGKVGMDDMVISSAMLPGGYAAIDLSGTDINITADSTLDMVTNYSATLGSLNFGAASVLTTTGADGEMIFADTTLANGINGFNTESDTQTGELIVGDANATIIKTGAADLILDLSAPAIGAGSLAFDVRAGRLIAQAGSTPLSLDSPVGINGGEVVLISSALETDATFDNPITSTGGTLTVGANGGANIGPLTLTLGNATTNNVTLTSGTLLVQATDDYTLDIAGDILGGASGGNMTIGAGSTVTVAKTIDAATITIGENSSLSVVGTVTVNELISEAGAAYSGPSNLTVRNTLTLNSGIDMTAATLVVDGANVTVSNGALAVKPGNNLGVATPVASVDVATGGGLTLNGSSLTTEKLVTTGISFDMKGTGSFIATGDVAIVPAGGPDQVELTGGTLSIGGGGISYAQVVQGNAPVVYYQFDEAAGATTAVNTGSDSGFGGAVNGTITFETSSVSGRLGTAADLGTDGYIRTGAGNTVSGTGNGTEYLGISPTATLEYFIKTDYAGNGRTDWQITCLYGGDDSRRTGRLDPGQEWYWGTLHDGKVGATGSGGITNFESDTAINDDEWHHIVMTRDLNEFKIYIDGVLDKDVTNFSTKVSGDFYNEIGQNRNLGTASHLNAMIDEVAIYNTTLSAEDVMDHFLAATASGSGESAMLPNTNLLMSAATTIKLAADITLGDLMVNNPSPATLTFTGDSEWRLVLANTSFTNPLTGTAPNLTIDTAAKVDLGLIDLVTTGSPIIDKAGAGQWIITQAPVNYTGDATYNVSAGTLVLGDTALLGAGAVVNVADGAAIKLSSTVAAQTYDEAITFSGDVTILAGMADSNAAAAAVVTLPTVPTDMTQSVTLGTTDAGYNLTITNPVTADSLNLGGVGTVTLAGGGTVNNAIVDITAPGTISVPTTLTVTNQITLGKVEITDNANMQIVGANLAAPDGTITVSGSAFTMGGGAPEGLLHRYSFDETGGSGTVLLDSIGGADGLIVEQGGNNADVGVTHPGQFYMTGGDKNTSDYATLPDGLYVGQKNMTIETWATQESVKNWSRVFSFGADTGNNLMMSWTRGTNLNQTRMAFKLGAEHSSDLNTAYNLGQEYHIVMTLEDDWNGSGETQLKAYRDGVLVQTRNTPHNLEDLPDTNNWIGRAKYGDNAANAMWDEFRIYDVALTPEQIAESFASGADGVGRAPISMPSLNLDLAMVGPAATLNLNGKTVTLGNLAMGSITDLTIAGSDTASFNNVMVGAAPTTINNGGAAIATTIRGMVETTGSGALSSDLSINGDLTMGAGSELNAFGANVTANSFTNNGGNASFDGTSSLALTSAPLSVTGGTTTFAPTSTVTGVTAIDVTAGSLTTPDVIAIDTLNVLKGTTLRTSAPIAVTTGATIGEDVVVTNVGPAFGVSGADNVLDARTFTLNGGTMTMVLGEIPYVPSVLFQVDHNDLPDVGEPVTAWGDFNKTGGNPVVVELGGEKWYEGSYDDHTRLTHKNGGYGDTPIPINGATIVTAVKPERHAEGNWSLVVDVFYDQLCLGVHNQTGRVQVKISGAGGNNPTWQGDVIPEEAGVLSLTVGNGANPAFEVFWRGENDAEAISMGTGNGNTAGQPYTALYPLANGRGYAQYLNIGRNEPDGWTNYNGLIGDTIVYAEQLSPEALLAVQNQVRGALGMSVPPLVPTDADFPNTTIATTVDSTLSIPGIDSTLTLGGIAPAGGTTLTIDSPSTDIQVTNMTLGAGSMVRSTQALDGDVLLTVSGTLTSGDGVSELGDSSLDDYNTNLTLADDSVFNWTFSQGDDRIILGGNLTLGENLTINLIDGLGGNNGDDVVLFETFQDYTFPDTTTMIYIPGTIVINKPVGSEWTFGGLAQVGDTLVLKNLVTGTASVQGDANGDQNVDAADLAIFKAQFGGEVVGNGDADFNGDGFVTLADFAIMRGNWGATAGEAPSVEDLSATPEPATMSLLAIGGLMMLRRRRRKA
jgi:hypothetical protein